MDYLWKLLCWLHVCLLGWSLWWKFKLQTLFQTIDEWDTDNVTAKSYIEGKYGNEQTNTIYSMSE